MHDQTPCTFVPRMRALDHPALSQHNKAFGVRFHGKEIGLPLIESTSCLTLGGVAHHLYAHVMTLRNGLSALPCVS